MKCTLISLSPGGIYDSLREIKGHYDNKKSYLTVTPGGETTDAPTFVEKPKIVTLNEGKLVQLIVKYKASSKCTCSWYYKETLIQQSQSIQVFHESISKNEYECRLEIQEPGPNTAGMYKCLVSNEKGEINANLMLNIQMAGQSEVTTDRYRFILPKQTKNVRDTIPKNFPKYFYKFYICTENNLQSTNYATK